MFRVSLDLLITMKNQTHFSTILLDERQAKYEQFKHLQ